MYIIGENIHIISEKVKEALKERDSEFFMELALKQVEAGAHILDVNAGVPGADEPAIMVGAVQAVIEVVEVPLCFDSANPEALRAALEHYPGKALINSTTAAPYSLHSGRILAIIASSAVVELIRASRPPRKTDWRPPKSSSSGQRISVCPRKTSSSMPWR